MKMRYALAAAAALLAVVVPTASATPPDPAGNPSIGIVGPGGQLQPIPPAVPKAGDTIESTWGVFYCDPSCNPNNSDTDPTVGNREVHPSGYGPPAGFFMEWDRCDAPGGDPNHATCAVIVPRSSDLKTQDYVVKPEDAGHYLRTIIYATNLDCGYPRSYDNHQDCAWQTRSVASALVPVLALPTVAITNASLPDGVAGNAYSMSLGASGGTGPYGFSVKSGSLPPGLALSAGGAISGTPTTGGTYTFTVQATASGANAGTKTLTIRIGLAVGPAALPAGTTGQTYNVTVYATGSTAPVQWSVTNGALPQGVTLGAGGLVSGTPTQKGTFTFTLQAIDASQASGSATYTITVENPTLLNGGARLPVATIGKRYSATLTILGGSAPYTFQLVQGKLPKGLRLGTGGAVFGKPLGRAATYQFGVLATDRYGAEGTFQFVLRTKAAPKKKK